MSSPCIGCEKAMECFLDDLAICDKVIAWEELEEADRDKNRKPVGIGEIGLRFDGTRGHRYNKNKGN